MEGQNPLSLLLFLLLFLGLYKGSPGFLAEKGRDPGDSAFWGVGSVGFRGQWGGGRGIPGTGG